MEIFACEGDAKNGMVSFVARSVESVELVPQQLTLGAETRLKLSWNTLETFNPEKLEVKLKGFTSIGKHAFLLNFDGYNELYERQIQALERQGY